MPELKPCAFEHLHNETNLGVFVEVSGNAVWVSCGDCGAGGPFVYIGPEADDEQEAREKAIHMYHSIDSELGRVKKENEALKAKLLDTGKALHTLAHKRRPSDLQ